jgi:hypothetical protein
MKNKFYILCVFFVLFFSYPGDILADFSGTWDGVLYSPTRDTKPVTIVLDQVGNTVTGTYWIDYYVSLPQETHFQMYKQGIYSFDIEFADGSRGACFSVIKGFYPSVYPRFTSHANNAILDPGSANTFTWDSLAQEGGGLWFMVDETDLSLGLDKATTSYEFPELLSMNMDFKNF